MYSALNCTDYLNCRPNKKNHPWHKMCAQNWNKIERLNEFSSILVRSIEFKCYCLIENNSDSMMAIHLTMQVTRLASDPIWSTYRSWLLDGKVIKLLSPIHSINLKKSKPFLTQINLKLHSFFFAMQFKWQSNTMMMTQWQSAYLQYILR